MSDDSGRNPNGTFSEGNTAHLTSGGGYGLESQANRGKPSARLMSAALKSFERIQAGGAGEMHDELAALAFAVAEGLRASLSHASEEFETDKSDASLSKLYSAGKHLHSWVALAARLLQWREENPHADNSLTPEDVIAKYREQNADTDS